MEEVEEELHC